MAGGVDILLQEKEIGTDFSKRIKSNLLSSIRRQVKKGSGLALRTAVKPVYKNGFLDRITIFTPYYIYPILHLGFEGSKKNGVRFRVAAKNFITEALENGKIVEDLADLVGSQRASAIVSSINFIAFDNNSVNRILGDE
jgi:hypothetical protein